MRRAALAALAAAILAAPATAAARGPINSDLTVGRGAGGVQLGDSRAEVVDLLGKPYDENKNGYMQYLPDNADGIFDVYRFNGAKTSRVRAIGVSDRRFRFKGTDQRVVGREVLPWLRQHYGRRVRYEPDEESGEPWYVVRTRFRGNRTFSSFSVNRKGRNPRVSMVFLSTER